MKGEGTTDYETRTLRCVSFWWMMNYHPLRGMMPPSLSQNNIAERRAAYLLDGTAASVKVSCLEAKEVIPRSGHIPKDIKIED